MYMHAYNIRSLNQHIYTHTHISRAPKPQRMSTYSYRALRMSGFSLCPAGASSNATATPNSPKQHRHHGLHHHHRCHHRHQYCPCHHGCMLFLLLPFTPHTQHMQHLQHMQHTQHMQHMQHMQHVALTPSCGCNVNLQLNCILLYSIIL